MENRLKNLCKIGGLLYLVIIVLGLFNELYIRGSLFVAGNSDLTAIKIISNEFLWRIGLSAALIMMMCAVPLVLIIYILLKPVNKHIALLAVFFNLVSISIEAINHLNLLSVLSPLANAEYLNVFDTQQLNTLAYLSYKLHSGGFNISLIFFGMNCFFWGFLIYKSGFFPKFLGVLLMICAACYVVNSFAWFIKPTFAAHLFPAILIPCFIAEAGFCIWLLIKGVDVVFWQESKNRAQNQKSFLDF